MSKGKQKHANVEYKLIPFDVLNVDYEGRTFEGYAAVFGNEDAVADIIHRGAFTKTLTERGQKVPVLWAHSSDEPIGRPLEMREDEKGLFVKAIISDTRRGRDALALLRDNAVDGLSIGYEPMKGGFDYEQREDKDPIRHLRELKLWEFSIVSLPANDEARILALKDEGGDAEIEPQEEELEPQEKEAESLPETKAERDTTRLQEIGRIVQEMIGENTGYVEEEGEKEEIEVKNPWHISEQDGRFCVIKDEDSSVEKCHDTMEEAEAHMAALYAGEKSADTPTRQQAGPDENPPTSEQLAEMQELELELLSM